MAGIAYGEAPSVYFRLVAPTTSTFLAQSPDGWMAWSISAVGVTGLAQRATSLVDGAEWHDYARFVITNEVMTQRLMDPASPTNMVFIPGGAFQMGDSLNDGYSYERPVHTVVLSPFYMDKYEVTKDVWDHVYSWATNNGYSFDNPGSGKATNHPVQTINWYDMVKWCNAKSQKENLDPCYTATGGVYKIGTNAPDCEWTANGYRLPTEAEWEMAARGGAAGTRFPWRDADTVQHARANYLSDTIYSFDTSPTRGYHPMYSNGAPPFTAPVGSFEPNDYGLYDMAGNIYEWCWDKYSGDYYAASPVTNPCGPTSGYYRIVRGAGWNSYGNGCRTAWRANVIENLATNAFGFRLVRSAW